MTVAFFVPSRPVTRKQKVGALRTESGVHEHRSERGRQTARPVRPRASHVIVRSLLNSERGGLA